MTGVPYCAALYLRLSRDDAVDENGGKRESDSIRNQREFLTDFVEQQKDIRIFDFYTDDGYSGINFERPGFIRMTRDIRSGKVNCVIVKDLSRFGRDYIETGRWIQRIYPSLQVRFIAVTDHYDSNTADVMEKALLIPVKNFLNDSYCRDISVKIRSHQQIKREKGEYLGAYAPYGYQKAAGDRNRLVPDEYASAVVRNIFFWKLEGFSLPAIADRLNTGKIPPPGEYKRFLDENYHSGFRQSSDPKWSAAQVKRILTNEIYTGTMVQGKQERISYKIEKRRDKPEREWIKVKDTHEAIVSPALFFTVRRLMRYDGRASRDTGKAHFFCGILFCGDCRTPMVRRINHCKEGDRVFYICQKKNTQAGCTRHSIPEEVLKKIVFHEIRFFINFLRNSGKKDGWDYVEEILNDRNAEELCRFMLVLAVEKILVYEKRTIEIQMRFQDRGNDDGRGSNNGKKSHAVSVGGTGEEKKAAHL